MTSPPPRSRLPDSPWLHEEVGRRMAERLPWIKLQPHSWLNWAPSVGGAQSHAAVLKTYPEARACLDGPGAAEALARWAPARGWNPFRRGPKLQQAQPGDTVDMVWANMSLHAESEPAARLADWFARLNTDGFLMFTCLGPDSLRELRAVHQRRGWPEPSLPFVDMHDWGDRLVGAGFAEPVMDMERIVLTYSDGAALIDELRGLGRNQHPQRFGSLRSRAWGRRYREALVQDLPRSEDGRLQLTFEVVYGHAFKPRPRVKPGEASAISLDDMRAMLRAPRAGG
ncbi:biotin synthase [Hydrogenophaga defluvii]|uniref:Biotin synthase n=1 Tax=Hydrogenophaga defluvii TaxID=249410 RepID=A0ABW2SFC3_9BURK